MSDDFFGIDPKLYGKWKSVKYNTCKTNISLWVALHDSGYKYLLEFGRTLKETDPEWRSAVLSYPYDTKDCLCKMCHYRRWFGPK